MLFKSSLVAAALLAQSLAAPTYLISIDIDIKEGVFAASPRFQPILFETSTHQDPPVVALNVTADEIKKDLRGIESRANKTAEAAAKVKKGDDNAIKEIVNDVALQAYGLLNLGNGLNGSNPLTFNQTKDVDFSYWTMTNGIYAELRALAKANQTLCSSSALSTFDQNLDSLSSTFKSASDALLELIPECPEDDPQNPSCELRGDVETAKFIIPDGVDELKDILGGGAEGCPYKASAELVQELK